MNAPRHPHTTTGRVVETDDGLVVDVGGARLQATQAVSCLVDAQVGDLVLVATGREGSWVLAILEREDAAVSLTVAGALTVSADSVALQARERLQATAPEIEATAVRTRVLVQAAELVAGTLDTVAEVLTSSVGRALRRVRGVDRLDAAQIERRADGLHRVHAGHTITTATELAKTDAPQIHVG
jgi:hypothetical protein